MMVSNGKIIIWGILHENRPWTSCSVDSLTPRANCRALSGAIVEGGILQPATLTELACKRLRLYRPTGG